MPVHHDMEQQIVVPGVKRRNNEVWKKIADVANEHQNFLQRLGFVEAQAIHARFIDPGVVHENEIWVEGKGKFMGHGLPWRSLETNSPRDDRQKIFDSFNRAAFDLPDSAQTLQDLESDGTSHKSSKRGKTPIENNSNKSTVFRGIKSDENKSGEKYTQARAKVDSGLRQKRAVSLRANHGVPQVHAVIHPKSPLFSKAGPLTIASKLPPYVGKANNSIIPSVIMGKGGASPGGTSSPKGNIKNYLDSMNVYTAYEQMKREKTQNLNVIANPLSRTGNAGLFAGKSSKPVSFWDYQSNHAKTATANYEKFIDSIMYSGNPVTVLKPPPRRSFNIPGLKQQESTQVQPVMLNPKPKQVQRASTAPALRMKVQPKKIHPSRLLPKHVPGPKYDNIYIGPYSGSDSEKDTDNEDDVMRSRRRPPSRRK